MNDVAGMFGSVEAGQQARRALLAAGFDDARIFVSACLTDDAIGAEHPGQSYEHQEEAGSDQTRVAGGWTDTDRARYGEEVRSAACIVSVRLERAADAGRVSGLLLLAGARRALPYPRD